MSWFFLSAIIPIVVAWQNGSSYVFAFSLVGVGIALHVVTVFLTRLFLKRRTLGTLEGGTWETTAGTGIVPRWVSALGMVGFGLFVSGLVVVLLLWLGAISLIKGNDAFYYRSLADSYVDKGEYEQAIIAYNESIKRHPGRADIIYDRGSTYYLMGDYQATIKDFTMALEVDPEPDLAENIYLARGYTYLLRLNDKKGCDDFRKACDIGNCSGYINAIGLGLCE